MIILISQMGKLRCGKVRKRWSQGWRAVSSFPWPPSALHAAFRPLPLSDPSPSPSPAGRCPSPSPKPELSSAPGLQGRSAWPGRSPDLNPGPLAPGLACSGQQARPVPLVSHAPGLWPPCRALWSEFGDERGLPWQQCWAQRAWREPPRTCLPATGLRGPRRKWRSGFSEHSRPLPR